MLHEPAAPVGKDPAAPAKMRLGVWMFLFYAIFYGAFVAINLTSPLLMERELVLGLNVATVYGMALIIGAFVQAMLYNRMCRTREQKAQQGEGR